MKSWKLSVCFIVIRIMMLVPCFAPVFDLQVEKVNTDGGLLYRGVRKKLPIRSVIYDDKSDMDMLKWLMKKLIADDNVQFIMPPCSTAFL